MTDTAALRDLFTDAGYGFVEPPILHDAHVFVELAGEDLRQRMFLTANGGRRELALRPDYTIPVCLHHLAGGAASRRGDYAYLGKVFRQRQDEPHEFIQAGIESLGRTDRIAADAAVLDLALMSAKTLGVGKPGVRIGDAALFEAVLKSLAISKPWAKRFARIFGEPERLRAMVAKATSEPGNNGPALGKPAARRKAEKLLAAAGLATVGSRTAEEIAARTVEKGVLAKGIGDRAGAVLSEFLTIAGRPDKAVATLRGFAGDHKLAMTKSIDGFARRLDAFQKRDIDLSRLAFAADFGRRLDYYTGFVFELRRNARVKGRPIVGGGRYDKLLGMIDHSGGTVPAVGFAIWLDRIGGGS